MDSYLKLAETVLKKMRRPLDARQILQAAYQLSIVPKGLYGKTQHKTLHARLAEDIRSERAKSEFVRTDPGRFFLRRLFVDPNISGVHKREYPARPRADQLRNFDVLCFHKSDVRFPVAQGLLDWSVLNAIPLVTRRLSDIYGDEAYLFLRTFVITQRLDSIVARRSVSRIIDALGSKSSLGSIGFVKVQDKTMFSTDSYGLLEASIRTLSEQLNLSYEQIDFIYSRRLVKVLGIMPAPADAHENSVTAVAVCRCPETFDPIDRYNDTGPMFWMSLHSKINDWASLDPWSRALLVSDVFETAKTTDADRIAHSS